MNSKLTQTNFAFTASRQENVRFLIKRGAQLNARDKEDNVISVINQNVPRAMEEFDTRLDTGISMKKDEAIITLDFTKIFQREKMREDTLETSLFSDLSQSQYQWLIEHPLCQTFLNKKFDKKVIWYFVFFIMVPHIIFSTIYSLYSGVFFGYLCLPKSTSSRWDFSEKIPCDDVGLESTKV